MTTTTTNDNNNQSQTTTDLEQFYTEVLKDLALQERLKAATNLQSLSELAVELGKEKGYSFPKEDVLAQLERSNTEEPLSDEQLEAVSGGASYGEVMKAAYTW